MSAPLQKLNITTLLSICWLVLSQSLIAEVRPTHAPQTRQILFVCTGNFYRSRFAEKLFNQKVQSANIGWKAISRGLRLVPSQHGISPYALRELKKRGVPVDLVAPSPRMVMQEDLDQSDYVVLLSEAEHRAPFEKQFPNYDKSKIHYWHIPDSGTMNPALACEKMSNEINALVSILK